MKLLKIVKENTAVHLIVISTVVLILYWQATGFDFVLDDRMVITENKFVQKGLGGLKEIFTKDSMAGYFSENPNLLEGGRYRPLSLAFFALGYQFFGLNQFCFHLFNIIMYIICCILAYFVLIHLLRNKDNSALIKLATFTGVLIYAVHPVHTEVVANIKGLDEILSFLFALAGFLAMLKFSESGKTIVMVISLVLLLFSFLAKESSLPVVAVIPVGLYFFKGYSLRRSLRAFLFLMIPAILYFVIRYKALGYFFSTDLKITGLMNAPYLGTTFTERYGTISYTLLLYLKLLFFPHPLTHDYYPWQVPLVSLHNSPALISLGVIILLLLLAIRSWRKNRLLTYSILFFFLMISIVSNIVVNVGTLMNERFLFIPSLAFSLFMIWGILKLNQLKMSWIALVISIIFLAGFSLKTADRLPDWKTLKSLNAADVVISKNSARAHLFYAVNLFQEIQEEKDTIRKSVKIKEGTSHINRSLEIYPEYNDAIKMKAGFAAESYKLDRDAARLLNIFSEVIRVKEVPFVDEFLAWLTPRADRTLMTDFYFNSGYNILISEKKNLKKGLSYLKQGYSVDPVNQKILFGLCVASNLSGEHSQSVESGNQYLKLYGENADILFYTGNSLIQSGQQQEGLIFIEKAFQLNPQLKNKK